MTNETIPEGTIRYRDPKAEPDITVDELKGSQFKDGFEIKNKQLMINR